MSLTLETTHAAARSLTGRPLRASRRQPRSGYIDPDRLSIHLDALYRAARAMCASQPDAEDLVQDTLANVLRRPRLLRNGNELGYLIRALKNTYSSRYRTAQRRPQTRQLLDHDAPASPAASVCSREILEAIASAPAVYRDAVIAVDLLGLSYREAAHSLGTSEATLTTRLHRGRQRIAGQLITETTTAR
jgi:RNA polymerase sigma-70 factor (ECF subfamily)